MNNAAADTRHEVALTILAQLGGGMFLRMVGGQCVTARDGLIVAFKGSKVANKLRVTLRADDTYDVEFFKMRNHEAKPVRSFEGAYSEDLQRLFTSTTGLYTRLF